MRGRQRRRCVHRATHRGAEIVVEPVHHLQTLLSLRTSGLRQPQAGVRALKTLDDLAEIVRALRQTLRGLARVCRASGECRHVELQALRSHFEPFERAHSGFKR